MPTLLFLWFLPYYDPFLKVSPSPPYFVQCAELQCVLSSSKEVELLHMIPHFIATEED